MLSLSSNNARSQKQYTVDAFLKKHEKEKKRAYNSRIMNAEHGTFTPLIFSLTGGESAETSMFHNHIAHKRANKTEEKYEMQKFQH